MSRAEKTRVSIEVNGQEVLAPMPTGEFVRRMKAATRAIKTARMDHLDRGDVVEIHIGDERTHTIFKVIK